MSCYNPIAAVPDLTVTTEKGLHPYRFKGSYYPEYKFLDDGIVKLPCGKCLGCRLDYSRSWADRMILELASMSEPKAIFVTLTYDNDHVPYYFDESFAEFNDGDPLCFSLKKKDVQDFFKRLRKRFKCRFYLCGEYGPRTGRPHYHAIIFGIGLSDFDDLQKIGRNELGQDYFTSKWFADRWSNGFVTMSDVSYNTCAYVSRYVMKKAFKNDDGLETYQLIRQKLMDPRLSEFVLMSRRPGIGKPYYDLHPEDALNSHIYVSSPGGSRKISVPGYFMDKVKLDFPEEYETIKKQRISAAADKELIKLSNTDLSYIDMLEVEYNELLSKTKILFNRRDV